MKKKKKKKPPTGTLKKMADKVFSVWIRQRGMDEHGFNSCYTCGARKHWKELQAGHYVSRAYLTLRYEPKNVKPQCLACNLFKKGNLDVYAIRLIEEYGQGILKELHELKYQYEKFGVVRYSEIIKEFKYA